MKIYNKEIDIKTIENIISEVRKNKKYSKLDDELILKAVKKYLMQNFSDIEKVSNKKSSAFEKLVKFVRKEYYDVYGLFQKGKLSGNLLERHVSTKERIAIYGELYEKIFAIIGKPKTILDLGCGRNPFSFEQMNLGKIKYVASDLSSGDLKEIQKYFDDFGINGETIKLDLSDEEDVDKLKKIKADVCFLFKVLDVVETKNKNITYKILSSINSPWIVVSFPRKNVKGELLRTPNRPWFERFCRNLKYEFTIIAFDNELFYLVKK